jgi:hypothetical protein
MIKLVLWGGMRALVSLRSGYTTEQFREHESSDLDMCVAREKSMLCFEVRLPDIMKLQNKSLDTQ